MIREYIAGSLDNIGHVYMQARYHGKWVFCFNSEIQKWECPGGHVELNETALEAAKRELYEETGATDALMIPVWDFEALKDDGSVNNNGRTYYVIIKQLGKLPIGSEMEKVDFFENVPENVYDRKGIIESLKRAEKYAQAYFK